MEQVEILKHLTDLFMQIGARTMSEPLAHFDEDLTASQLLALRFVLLHPECALSELANGLDISNPAATKVMDRLEKKGLVQRVQGSDRRQIKAVITPKGRRIGEDYMRLQLEAYASLLDTMDEDDRSVLQKGLEAIVRASVKSFPNWEQFCLRCGIGCTEEKCPLHVYREL